MVVPALLASALSLALLTGSASGAVSSRAADGRQQPAGPTLTESAAVAAVRRDAKVASWLARYDRAPGVRATFGASNRRWRVSFLDEKAGEIARGVVTDSGLVVETWTGPQVAWGMARGRPGAFGGKVLLWWPVWVSLSAVFLLGLGDLRRPFALRNLDLLALLSFGVSLAFFNHGKVFQSAGLAAIPLAYLLVRSAWIGLRGRPLPRPVLVAPVWLLAAAAIFLLGFRIGINVSGPSSVIDVGYAGVIGADRILDGQAPYGHMPAEGNLPECGPANTDGRVRDRIQVNGRCESSNEHGDTYGPLVYLAYVPFVGALGWSGKWDELWAAHAAAIAFDVLTLVGLVVAGLRFGGRRVAALLAFAWTAYPFTAYALAANTNDSLVAALLVWGFVGLTAPPLRGLAVGAAAAAKFVALPLVPLWLSRRGLRGREPLQFAAGLLAALVACMAVLLLEPGLWEALRTFWDRTLGYQLARHSPFSPWDWGQYHARGVPDLGAIQLVLLGLVLAFAGALAAVPRRKSPLQLAALTAAVLAGLELCLTHWSYLYLPWLLPFVAMALLLPGRERGDR